MLLWMLQVWIKNEELKIECEKYHYAYYDTR